MDDSQYVVTRGDEMPKTIFWRMLEWLCQIYDVTRYLGCYSFKASSILNKFMLQFAKWEEKYLLRKSFKLL